MPVLVSCSCGKQLRVPDEYVGKRVKCTACGEVQTVSAPANGTGPTPAGKPAAKAPAKPAAAPAKPAAAPASPAVIRFECGECGKQMQARPEHAGRTAKCPGCGAAVAIPGPEDELEELEAAEEIEEESPKSRIKAEKPAPRSRKIVRDEDEEEIEEAEDVDEDEEESPRSRIKAEKPGPKSRKIVRDEDEDEEAEAFDEDEDDRPRKKGKKAGKDKKSSNLGLWIGIGAGVFLLLVGGGLTAWLMGWFGGGGGGSDMAFVPGDAQAFTVVQVAALWKTPLVQEALQNLPPDAKTNLDEVDKKFGVKLEEIDRVVQVIKDSNAKQMWVVVSTTKPFDRKKVATELELDPAERKHQGKAYQVSKKTGTGCIHFVSDKMILGANEEEALKAALNQVANPSKGNRLANSLKLVDGKNLVVVGFQPPAELVAQGKQGLQGNPFAASFAPLLDLQGGAVTVNVAGKTVSVEVTVNYGTDPKAKEAKNALDTLKGMANGALLLVKDPKLVEQAQTALRALVIEQRGPDVVVKTSSAIDVKEIVKAAGGLMGGAGGAAGRVGSQNNLKQIGLAFHNYADSHNGQLPPTVVYKGNLPMYSWRVEVLPYLEQQQLYNTLRDKPSNNTTSQGVARAQMPKLFEIPGRPAPAPGMTFYQVFTGPKALFDAKRQVMMPASFQKGTSNMILAVEAKTAVFWTDPKDIPFDPNANPLDQLGWDANGFCNVLMADGSVQRISRNLNPQTLKNAISPDGPAIQPGELK